MIISRRMRWVGYVACIGKIENHMQIFDQKSRREVITWRTAYVE
jgi:hypothetical protein